MSSSAGFKTQIKVRFNHVDAAGIVFYPRYYEMLNEVVERWLEEGLGTSFRELHLERGLGLPARRITVDFAKPSRLGDLLTFTLQVSAIGLSAITLQITCDGAGEARLVAELVLVSVSLEPLAAVPISDELRARMDQFTV